MFDDLFNQYGLSLERLHALVQLAEAGSLIRAAKGDVGLQSRYSHYLKELSAYFGIELTERVGKGLRLTAEGVRLVQLMTEHFQNLQMFRNDVLGKPTAFKLGADDSQLQWLVIGTIASLRRSKDNTRYSLETFTMEEIIARLQDHRLDFGIVSSKAQLKGLKYKPTCSVRHFIVVPDLVSPKRGGALTLEQALLDCPHAALIGDDAMRRSVQQIAADMKRRFEPELECQTVAQCAAAVRTGQFASILPQWSWVTETSIAHSVCEDELLGCLDQDLVLAWHPRLISTRGRPAQEAIRELVSGLAKRDDRPE